MHKRLTIIACIGIGTGIALGAFGAHGLRRLTSDDSILQSYQTGVDYQLFHALAFLILGLWGTRQGHLPLKRTAILFLLVGVALFSGSLYVLTVCKLNGWNTGWVGPITPIGGTCLILGWCWLAYSLVRAERSN